MLPIVAELAEKLGKLSPSDLKQALQELNDVISQANTSIECKTAIHYPIPPSLSVIVAPQKDAADSRCIGIEAIQREVAFRFGIKLRELKGSSRLQSVARPRMIAMWLARTLTKLSFPEIGRAFNGKDHSTVICAVNKIGRLLTQDQNLAAVVAGLEGRLKQPPGSRDGEPAALEG